MNKEKAIFFSIKKLHLDHNLNVAFFNFEWVGVIMYRVSYVSSSVSDKEQLLEDLRNILTEARDFNVFHHITGVLYFADGTFFQCLEGPIESIEILINKLNNDSRHRDMKLFETHKLHDRLFGDWSMKYVRKNSIIQKILQNSGFSNFNPRNFSQQQVDELVQVLSMTEDCKV